MPTRQSVCHLLLTMMAALAHLATNARDPTVNILTVTKSVTHGHNGVTTEVDGRLRTNQHFLNLVTNEEGYNMVERKGLLKVSGEFICFPIRISNKAEGFN